MKRLLNVSSDNGSDATAAVMRLLQLVNACIGYEQMRKPNHVHCAKIAVLKVLKLIKEPTEALGKRWSKLPQQGHVAAISRRGRGRWTCKPLADAPGFADALELIARNVR